MSNFSPLVSVIVPNYNHATFLPERLDSVFNQTYQNFEVILLDDKSTDNSVDVLREYAKNTKVSHFIANEENSGSTFKQWKKGLSLAKGEYIWIAESDDYAELNFLEIIISGMVKDKEIVIGFCRSYNLSYEDKQGWSNFESKYPVIEQQKIIEGKTLIEKYFRYGNLMNNASAVVFKKSAISKDIWSTIEDMRYTADWIFWVNLCLQNNVYYTPLYLNHFRHHNQTTRSVQNKEKELKKLKELNFVLAHIHIIINRTLEWDKYDYFLMTYLDGYRKLQNNKIVMPPINTKLLVRYYFLIVKNKILSLLDRIR